MKISKSIIHFFLYQMNQFSGIIISLILLPIATRVMTPEEYGVLKNLQALIPILTIFFSFYLSSAWIRYYYEYKHDHHSLAVLTSTIIYFMVIINILFILPAFAFSQFFLKKINIDANNYILIILFLIPFSVSFKSLSSVGICLLQQKRKNVSINVLDIINGGINILITLFCLIYLRLKEISYFYASFVISSTSIVFSVYNIIKYKLLIRAFSIKLLKKCLKFSISSLPLSLTGWIYNFSDQILLAYYGGVALSGKYALTYKVGQLIQTIYISFFYVANPYHLEYLNDRSEEKRKQLVRLISLGFFILINAGIFLIFFGQWILNLLAPQEYILDPIILVLLVL